VRLDAYQDITNDTAVYPQDYALEYLGLGLASEAGEVAGKLKKIIRDQGGTLRPEDVAALKSELGDVLWYTAQLADKLGLWLSDVAQTNAHKLYDRKERGALQGSGDNR
jgi:NTP pyrophosphatase (non-canonical NTP hydrolase)